MVSRRTLYPFFRSHTTSPDYQGGYAVTSRWTR